MKSYIPYRPERPSVGINWDDLDVKNINLKATDLRFKGGVEAGETPGNYLNVGEFLHHT